MKRLIFALTLLTIMATAQSAGAQELLLNESTSHVDISENSGHEKVTLSYVISQVGENALQDSVLVYGSISGVNVYDQDGVLTHSESVEGDFTMVRFYLREGLGVGDRSVITVEFTKATTTTNGSYRYEIRCMWSTTPVSYRIIATLPAGYELLGTTENALSISTEDDKLQLRWFGVQENQFFTSVTFRMKSTAPEDGEGGQPAGTPYLPYVFLLLAAAASLGGVWVILKIRPEPEIRVPREMRRPRALSKEDIQRILLLLTEHERNVVKVLVRKDNLTQRELCDRTGIPKATMSRILQRLEGKGVVKREGHGFSKRVLLTKWARRWRRS